MGIHKRCSRSSVLLCYRITSLFFSLSFDSLYIHALNNNLIKDIILRVYLNYKKKNSPVGFINCSFITRDTHRARFIYNAVQLKTYHIISPMTSHGVYTYRIYELRTQAICVSSCPYNIYFYRITPQYRTI